MIARDSFRQPPAEPGNRGYAAGLLTLWRRWLTRATAITTEAVRPSWLALRSAVASTSGFFAGGAFRDLRHPALAGFGVAAVWVGAVGGIAIASSGIDRRSAALAGLASLVWMVVRWLVLRLVATKTLVEDPAGLLGAYATGLLCYAIAVTPELRLAAWAGSAALTAFVLVRMGHDRRELLRAVALAWGVHALVVVGGWIARSAFVAFVTLRG